jgi:hypothetical protein
MTSANHKNRAVAALDYLRGRNQYFRFDNNERVVEVGVSVATNTDEIAAHVGNLRDLESLTFSRTDLTDEGLRHLADLVRLKELSIGGARITSTGLASLAAMSQLEYLYIETARDLDLAAFACIACVPTLRRLLLHGGSFCDADLQPLAALVNLEELLLSENDEIRGTFCKQLIGLPRLRRLLLGEIGGQVTDGGLASIAALSGLVQLNLEGPFTNAGLEYLIELKDLTTLEIRSEHVTAEGIAVVAEFPKLESLHLDTPRLADDCIAALLRCSALEEMSFTRSALSDAGLQHLRDNLPKCEVRDLQRDLYEFGPPVDMKDIDRPRLDNTAPFLTLLAQACDNDLINGTFHKIGDRYDHWVDATQYSPEERVIMLVWHSSGIIDNGGFEYLFAGAFPGDPDYRITAEAYKTAGLLRGYAAFQEAFALFPGGAVPHDSAERDRLFQAANRSARDRIKRKLWQDGRDGSREKKLAEFIRKNAARLGDLDNPR